MGELSPFLAVIVTQVKGTIKVVVADVAAVLKKVTNSSSGNSSA